MNEQASFTLRNRNPDVLTCIANLSNDEVFTPPELASKMLDILTETWANEHNGENIWENKNIKFLDPCTKSGVFLREITSRLTHGLEQIIPNLDERVDHILSKQVYGIGITKLTSLLARRSVYCSKSADGEHSIAKSLKSKDGNIWYENISHNWIGEKCKYCGASKSSFNRKDEFDNHAYAFIHTENIKNEISKYFGEKMQFDVIIGNPPYQISDGGGTGDSAKPIYHHFIEQAISLSPNYLIMVVPSRWLKGGKGLDEFRDSMMSDTRIQILYDYENAKECFQGINLDGGVCYFLWNRQFKGKVNYIYKSMSGDEIKSQRFLKSEFSDKVIRDYRQLSILEKVAFKKENKFSDIVSSRKPYGIATDLFNDTKKYGYESVPTKPFNNSMKIYGVKGNKGGAKRVVGYIDKKLVEDIKNAETKWKLFHSYAYTTTATVPPEIIVAPPNEVCTETFLRIGNFDSEKDALNCLSYIKTKFFRALLSYNRIQKNLSKSTFELIPIQDFSISWTDADLYKKYGLTQEEIDLIENNIKAMV